ncbi:MAG: two-component regulator propeller domain-containing protein [Chloroflexota bacterium]|nr:two-component regulator propeller domain-containing protein [Chloroflexota bacterium]
MHYDQSDDIKFERISVEQGLSQSTVNCIIQDSQGFLWFGTRDGLNKYDGYGFTVYRHNPDNPDSLSHNVIRSIHEDQSGILWIGTDGGGLDKFDRKTERFIHYRNDPKDFHSLSYDTVTSIYQDREGVLWVGTWVGLDRFDAESEQFTRYRPRRKSKNTVNIIYEDRAGMLWVGTSGGLAGFNRDKEKFTHYQNISYDPRSLSNNVVRSIYQDQEGVLWIGTEGGGINRFDRENEQFTRYLIDPGDIEGFAYNDVVSVYEDRAGVLWIGTEGGGLYQFDREQERFIGYQTDPNHSNSLSSNYIRSIYQDQQGILWIGTWDGGINKYDRGKEKFVHYQNDPNDSNSLNHNRVLSVYEDREGALWIGTDGKGLDRFDREKGRFTHYQHIADDPYSLSNDYVISIYEDREGVLWIGTIGGGLNRFDREKEEFIHYQNVYNELASLSGNVVKSIHQDRTGTLWIGTLGGGLNRFDRETEEFTRYQHAFYNPRSLSSDYITFIHEDREGVLWIGTWGGGLDRFDRENERFIHYQNDPGDPHSLSDKAVFSICEDRSGVLWIGTEGGGLNRFDRATETFTHYDERDGLPSDTVSGILEDERGFLWLSTRRGLSRFDPQTEEFKNYSVSDGLQGYEFSSACCKNRGGEMFFGGINGLNAFYPEDLKDNLYVPHVALTRLTQGGEDVNVGQAVESIEEVTFHWPNNFFEFEFAALNYSQPERNQYAYMLEEFDDDWIYVGTRRFGKYTNLPGGTYTLRLKGSNNDGFWNEEGASVNITIVPPFWATWWFRGLAGLVLVGSAIGGYRLRVRRVEVRNRELKDQVMERTHALEERTRETEQRRQELEALYRADAELHRHLRLDQVLQALVDIVVDILQADKSSLMIWDDQHEKLVVRVARGFCPETLANMSFAPGVGTVGYVAATGEPAIVEDARADPRVAKRITITEREGIRSYMQVPITVGGEVFGVFSADYLQPHAFDDDERRLFVALAQRAALAVDTAQLYEQSQELAVVEERSRLARDLHDAVTQTLFSASLIAEALPTLWESSQDEGRQLLKELRQLSRGALAEMRTLLLELRPAALGEASLGDLLRHLAEAVTGRTGLPVTVTLESQCVLPSDVHVALYRIAQEALNNVVKHAHASHVKVSLRRDSIPLPPHVESGVELCISDDGCGFDPSCIPPDRLGLGIIRERTQAIGAKLKVESQPGHGTRVIVVWKG